MPKPPSGSDRAQKGFRRRCARTIGKNARSPMAFCNAIKYGTVRKRGKKKG